MTDHYPSPTGPQSAPPGSATHLAQLLQRGERPPRFAVPLRLEPGEECYAQGPANVEMFVPGGDGSYVHKTRFGLSPLGVAVGIGTVLGNQARKAKAARDAQERWRPMGRANVFVTTQRIAINQGHDWTNIWYRDVMTANCDGQYIQLQRNGDAGLRLNMPNLHYFYVMFYWLAFDQVLQPPSMT
jgi:hypothetical protein